MPIAHESSPPSTDDPRAGTAANGAVVRRRLDVRGQVQGVGFRPFVYRLATARALGGFVANNAHGAVIEIEGAPPTLTEFEQELRETLPPLARITALTPTELPPRGDHTFRIATSDTADAHRPEVTPDAALCPDCQRELFDPADRRHRYPFINCTNCGPRYSIIRTVPYDRPATTMAAFTMCGPCAREYADPADRRFHAQPNACPVCGPRLRLCRRDGSEIDGDPIRATARLLADERIVAVKGIGGYHLACRADSDAAVARLRERKLRDGKPLAIMVADVAAAQRCCRLADTDIAALRSRAAPIVLAPQAAGHRLSAAVAPGCRDFGVMLSYAPLHHLLFAEGLGPLVMTSANLSGQPLTYRDEDALVELADVADAFLLHDREIFRPIDDSVVFSFRGATIPLRRARGYAPRPVRITASAACARQPESGRPRILALGGELKSTICLLNDDQALVSEHLGDLTNPQAYRHFVAAIDRLRELFAFTPDVIACDLHPQYLSTQYAQRLGLPVVAVQHHHAHIAAVLAEWGESGPVIGLACDGTGYGTDGAVWGCEVLRCERDEFDRVGHLAYFPLVGGDAAALETWRPAAALLRAALGDGWTAALARCAPDGAGCTADGLRVFEQQVAAAVNAPPTSSLGRVFDAASFLLGLCARNRHEAEAALALEAAAESCAGVPTAYEYTIDSKDGLLLLSLAPMVRAIAADRLAGGAVPRSAARFHETIARVLADAAQRAGRQHGISAVALSGGCFANRRLLARVVGLLEAAGLRGMYHREFPSGDGGLALGQAAIARWRLSRAAED